MSRMMITILVSGMVRRFIRGSKTPAWTSWINWSTVPPAVKLATVQTASYWALSSPVSRTATKGGSALQAIGCWVCWQGPAATLLRAQAASFWMEGRGCVRSWGRTARMAVSRASWVWWSVPVTMFPTVRREGVKTLSSELLMSSTSLGRTPVSTTWLMCASQPSVR